ncbi:MAG: hypothetical protein Q7T10_18910 [Rhodoferax sp.]|uniref:hypothetical protein n=1 Tax=Rhodoferax sp. TaxID=50421 RepID=UPI00272194B2|nr:hypothetical protein [Rhodoferax sp.]MDO8450868.1 hypothetical protein [Rhodoferax sp.]
MARIVFHFLLGLAGFLVFCELALQVLPVSTATATGYHLDPLILTYPPRHAWTIATGWDLRNAQNNRSNNVGFLAHRDFAPDPRAVALIGDSFVEASMLAADDRPGQQLERGLGDRPVFTMGGPGSALLDYAERIRLAQLRYGVRDFVLLMERGDVRQSLCGSGNIQGPCLDRMTLAPRTEIQAPPSAARRILRHSALAQYVFGQLKFDPDRLWRQAIAQSRPVAVPAPETTGWWAPQAALADMPSPGLDAVVTTFFARIEGKVAGKLVIVLDSDRTAMYRGQPTDDAARARFIAMARAAGAIVIDTEPLFRAQLARSPLKFDVGPYDGHLNALGVRIVTQAAAEALHNH